jgi:nitroimidazol reductase NimA-like FMN-containing flavoprotein (pyridoxamine 5'-phosphate oxidase superfamily)
VVVTLILDGEAGNHLEIMGNEECLTLLAEKSVGRVAVSMGAIPAVFPVNYTLAGGSIYFLTDEGTKFAAALRGAVVAFEIDEVDVQYHQGWSVLAVGESHVVDAESAADLMTTLPLQPWAPGAREHLVRITPEFVSGRKIGFTEDG